MAARKTTARAKHATTGKAKTGLGVINARRAGARTLVRAAWERGEAF
jgi:hypothetical protein